MRKAVKAAFVIYVTLLLWLVLFKTSTDIISVITTYQARSINLVPFTGHLSEMLENFIIFIPFGLLLGAALKKSAFWKKSAYVLLLSVAIETIQFVLAIGVSDITDVITNTLGGLLGLAVYKTSTKGDDTEKTDRMIIITITALAILALILRFFVFRVRY